MVVMVVKEVGRGFVVVFQRLVWVRGGCGVDLAGEDGAEGGEGW